MTYKPWLWWWGVLPVAMIALAMNWFAFEDVASCQQEINKKSRN